MKKHYLMMAVFSLIFGAKGLCAEQADDLSKSCEIVSVSYSVPDNDQQNFEDVNFRFGWKGNAPATLSIQFINDGYSVRSFKFAIKDITSKKMIVLDAAHHAHLGSETLSPNSTSVVWSGPVDDLNDSLTLRVWNDKGDQFDKVPISITDQ